METFVLAADRPAWIRHKKQKNLTIGREAPHKRPLIIKLRLKLNQRKSSSLRNLKKNTLKNAKKNLSLNQNTLKRKIKLLQRKKATAKPILNSVHFWIPRTKPNVLSALPFLAAKTKKQKKALSDMTRPF